MSCRNFLLLAAVAVASARGAHLPKYLKACSRSDPKLNECALKSAIEAAPRILEGDKQFHIPYLKPLELSEIVLDPGSELKVKFTKCKIYGLEDTVIKSVNFDIAKQQGSVTLLIPFCTLLADYEISGRILILPITGHGPSNITFAGGEYTYNFDWTFVDRNGKQYGKISNYNLDYTTTRNYFYLENLFNGDKALGEQMNKFLNENWQEVTKDVGVAISKTLGAICNSIATQYFNRVPFDEFFLP